MSNRGTERLVFTFLTFLAVLAATPAAAFADAVSVPEPGTLVLVTTGAVVLAGLGWLRRR